MVFMWNLNSSKLNTDIVRSLNDNSYNHGAFNKELNELRQEIRRVERMTLMYQLTALKNAIVKGLAYAAENRGYGVAYASGLVSGLILAWYWG